MAVINVAPVGRGDHVDAALADVLAALGADVRFHRLPAPLSVIRGEELLDRLTGLVGGHDEQEGRRPLDEFRVA